MLDRFNSKIHISESCWLWLGSKYGNGYGAFHVNRIKRLAHRVSYEIHIGEIDPGMVLDHICRVRHCVNPKHLRVVTRQENTLASGSESVAKKNADKKVCPKCCSPFSFRLRGDKHGGIKRYCMQCRRVKHK